MADPVKLPTDLTPLILQGHVIDVLRTLPDDSVHCVVTSPPYWGLRAYGTDPQVWGGDAAHLHEWSSTPPRRGRKLSDSGYGDAGKYHLPGGGAYDAQGGELCACGAWRGELGLEPTPELYVSHLADVFDEIRRVLRRDGTLWLNLGDTYTTHPAGLLGEKRWKASGLTNGNHVGAEQAGIMDKRTGALPEKNLVGIPWRVAFELQRRGWFLRSDVIWSKPNPMPESITDRPTRSHEYIFLLTKEARYYYDADAVRNPLQPSTVDRMDYPASYNHNATARDPFKSQAAPGFGYAKSTIRELSDGYDGRATKAYGGTGAQDPSATKARIIEGMRKRGFTNGICDGCGRPEAQHVVSAKSAMKKFGENAERVGVAIPCNSGGANLKTVWQIATQPYAEAHFATFPEAIPERCIRLGTSEKGACASCGAPWERAVEHTNAIFRPNERQDQKRAAGLRTAIPGSQLEPAKTLTVGWSPTCSCSNVGILPCVVLDPFSGSGTTCYVARQLSRRSIGIELNPAYIALANRRSGADTPSLERFHEEPESQEVQ